MHGAVIIEKVRFSVNRFKASGDFALCVCIIFAAAIDGPAFSENTAWIKNIDFLFDLLYADVRYAHLISRSIGIIFFAFSFEPSGLKGTVFSDATLFPIFFYPFVFIHGSCFFVQAVPFVFIKEPSGLKGAVTVQIIRFSVGSYPAFFGKRTICFCKISFVFVSNFSDHHCSGAVEKISLSFIFLTASLCGSGSTDQIFFSI